MANVVGPVKRGDQLKHFEFDVAAAAASEVFTVGPYDVISCAHVYLTAAAPTAPVFVFDSVAGTVTMSGHQAGSSMKVCVITL